MWVKARAVLVIETVSIVAKGSKIRAIDRAPHFPSNRKALAPFRSPDEDPFCRRRQQMTPPGRASWCFFVRCPREGTFVPASAAGRRDAVVNGRPRG
jgi:hypothetical protein